MLPDRFRPPHESPGDEMDKKAKTPKKPKTPKGKETGATTKA